MPRPLHPLLPLAAAAGLAALADRVAAAPQAEEETLAVAAGRSAHLRSEWPILGASLTDPAVADVELLEPRLVLVSGRSPGATDLFLWGEDDRARTVRIEVTLDVAPLERTLRALLPGAELELEQVDGLVLVRGRLADAEQSLRLRELLAARAADFVDATELPGVQQVQIQVRVAEVSRTGLRTLGMNAFGTSEDLFWGTQIGPGGSPVNPFSIGPPEGASGAGNTPFVFSNDVSVASGVTLFAGLPDSDLEVFVQALEQDQYLRILAEPNLVALSGEEASFLAGGEFPVPVVQGSAAGGGTSITIEYKEFGVRLKFRPIVLGGGRMRLQVASEVSELTDVGAVEIEGFSIPSIFTRRAETVLEMGSGQTFAMAGLIQESTNAIVDRVPWLGSIPVLGALFRSVRYRHGETELLVLVTPKLVEPLSTPVLPPLPGETHVPPSDWELYAEGWIEGRPPARLSAAHAAELRALGLDELEGPGAWATHERRGPRSNVDLPGPDGLEPGADGPEEGS